LSLAFLFYFSFRSPGCELFPTPADKRKWIPSPDPSNYLLNVLLQIANKLGLSNKKIPSPVVAW
jgi:hypothetical protein